MHEEKQRFINSLLYPTIFLLIIWLVKIIEVTFKSDFYVYGIFPLTAGGLKGILLSPFIHGDFSHLISNSLPLLVLGAALFYFYRSVAFRVLIFSMLITGFWVWIAARPSFHIGASGIIYSLAAFLFTSGVIRKHPRLMAISLLVVFIYGGMVWGIFPIKERVSWESHLMGMTCGIFLAFFFKKHGPQRKLYSWDYEDEVIAEDPEKESEEEEEEEKEPIETKGDQNTSSHTGYGNFHIDYRTNHQ
jgi:membrane associated rhomboid family serine protease